MGMRQGHVANTADALKKHAEKEAKTVGKTIKVRAIAKGYYGLPLADTIEPGTEFRMRVADLKPKKKLRLQATWSGTTYELFTGFVDGWPQTYGGPATATSDVVATDASKFLAQRTINADLLAFIQA